MTNTNIYPFPMKDASNPFLGLFYHEVHQHDKEGTTFFVRELSLRELLRQAARVKDSRNIIHIHWSTILYGSKYTVKSLYLLIINFSAIAILKWRYSFKIIWTMHNFKSHDYPHPFIDSIGRKILFSLSDCIVVQQYKTQKILAAQLPAKFICYIPLGNYIGAYGNAKSSREEVRASLGCQTDDILILSFGAVRPYKKIDEIIKTCTMSLDLSPKIQLRIIGSASDEYARALRLRIDGNSCIQFSNRFVQDDEFADLLLAGDFSVFWFDDSVLTSSGVILSLSYGLPIIARDIPAMERVVDKKSGYLFHDAHDFQTILQKLPELPVLDRNDAIRAVSGDTWDIIADSFMKICIQI